MYRMNLVEKTRFNSLLMSFIFLISYSGQVLAKCSDCDPNIQRDFMIIKRPFWENLIENAWQDRSIIWLMGVRRVGKTSLCKSLPDIELFDCESRRVRELLIDYEAFLESKKGKRIILDEIHKLDNPSEILKIAADYYPDVKIIATGSSTLGASAKFSDTLTGRKREIWLTPMFLEEMQFFGAIDIRHRFLFGGFPSIFVQEDLPETFFQEWIDAYWAKDIQELFTINKRSSFLKFTELLLVNSGGMFEATKYSVSCELSRETVFNYLQILEETFIVHIIRPFSTHKTTEIVKAPKVYGFDTGFICSARAWTQIRSEDTGVMWEHVVLNEIQGHLQTRLRPIHYWRDKNGHEIDFIIPHRSRDNRITAIECKFNISSDDVSLKNIARNFQVFRDSYPVGENLIVAHNISESYTRTYKDVVITFVSAQDLVKKIELANRRQD